VAQGKVKISLIVCAYMKQYHTFLSVRQYFFFAAVYEKSTTIFFSQHNVKILKFVKQEKVVKLTK
jgi:hypothetical protein